MSLGVPGTNEIHFSCKFGDSTRFEDDKIKIEGKNIKWNNLICKRSETLFK